MIDSTESTAEVEDIDKMALTLFGRSARYFPQDYV